MLPILDREYPHFRVFWIAFASLVAFSRLYLGVHYLSDVVTGAAIGYLIGFGIMRFAEGKLWKSWN
jgi:undecaprenyl-diphosphatase